jgi:hypothetical protein
MGSTSAQGAALLVFLVAFTFLGLSLFNDGSVLYFLIFVVALAGSIVMFLKAKSAEGAQS